MTNSIDKPDLLAGPFELPKEITIHDLSLSDKRQLTSVGLAHFCYTPETQEEFDRLAGQLKGNDLAVAMQLVNGTIWNTLKHFQLTRRIPSTDTDDR